MTRSTISLKTRADDIAVARLAAVAIALTCIENAMPSPIPGVKPGLANIVTLLVLYRFGWNIAAQVSVLRIMAASLLFGSFLSPGFILSLGGGLASLATLWLVDRALPRSLFGPISASVCAAFTHIAAQLAIVYGWLIPHSGVFALVPLFATAALVTGIANGLLAAHYLPRFTAATAAFARLSPQR